MPDGQGSRANTGKRRYRLEPTLARIYATENLMRGAVKYDDFNWARGMSWSTVIECAERHLMKIKAGIDIDPEDNLPHAAKVISNMQFLLEFIHTYPQGDDRRHQWLDMPKIGLDIDEVLADWVGAWIRVFGGERPKNWAFDYRTLARLEMMAGDREFWMGIDPVVPPDEIPFEPTCYITARSCSVEMTEDWIQAHGFPTRPVINVGLRGDKVEAAKSAGIDIYVDDNFETFVKLNRAGVTTYLFDRPHNRRYNVGSRRITHLKQLVERPT